MRDANDFMRFYRIAWLLPLERFCIFFRRDRIEQIPISKNGDDNPI